MLRSLYSAVSGVKSHQTYLDVTGNNIANVNTVGFKRDSLQFRDMIYQNARNASGPNSSIPIGGINPAQVGLGVQVGSIETVHTGGSMQSTGVPTDMAISGSGFFVVRNGTQQLYTRAGNFALDAEGNLVMSGNGYLVQGYSYKEQVNPATGTTERVKDTNLTNINIPIGEKIPAKATTLLAFRCNLCSSSTAEITDLNNIPGGANSVIRPHEYSAYGATSVTSVEATAPTTGMVAGDTYYNTTDNKLYKYTTTGTPGWQEVREADPKDVFYTANPNLSTAPDEFATLFTAADGTTGVVAKRSSVDLSGATAPATPPTKAGQTYLDTTTGQIYTANATGSAWLSTTTPVVSNTVYADLGSGALYGVGDDGTVAAYTGLVMDPANGYNIFSWDGAAWSNLNQEGLFASNQSVTTQETIDKFGESMIKSRDHEVKVTVYDSLGNPYTLITAFRKVLEKPADPANAVAAEAEWDWYSYYVDSDGKIMEQYGEGAGTLVFGDDGLLKRTYYYEPTPATPNPNATPTTQPVYNWSVVEKVVGDPAYDGVATGKVVADFNVAGAQGSVQGSGYESNMITLDFLGEDYARVFGTDSEPIGGVTQYGSTTTTKAKYQDGYAMGELNGWSVGGDGIIMGTYSNGRTLPIAQVALAMFANEQGLEKVGNTCFAETINSGMAQVGEPMAGGAGSIVGNTIEMSNVDLSEEFVNLIRAQRGFQANSRVVTTSDQVLEELINLKR